MAEGFLKGMFGKPAQQGTGIYGLWGTIKNTPTTIFKTITSPIKLIGTVIVVIIIALLYKRMK